MNEGPISRSSDSDLKYRSYSSIDLVQSDIQHPCSLSPKYSQKTLNLNVGAYTSFDFFCGKMFPGCSECKAGGGCVWAWSP